MELLNLRRARLIFGPCEPIVLRAIRRTLQSPARLPKRKSVHTTLIRFYRASYRCSRPEPLAELVTYVSGGPYEQNRLPCAADRRHPRIRAGVSLALFELAIKNRGTRICVGYAGHPCTC